MIKWPGGSRAAAVTSARMPDFDTILSPAIKAAALRNGSEWVLPSPQVEEAIQLASEYLIAVLGVEAFHIQENGLCVENYTGYAFDFRGDRQGLRLHIDDQLRRGI
jgi:hypothetical protein